MYRVIFSVVFVCLCGCGTTEPSEPTSGTESKPELATQAMNQLLLIRSNPNKGYQTLNMKYNAILEKKAVLAAMDLAKYDVYSPLDPKYQPIGWFGTDNMGYTVDFANERIEYQDGWRYCAFIRNSGSYSKISDIDDKSSGGRGTWMMDMLINNNSQNNIPDTVAAIFREHLLGYGCGAIFNDVGVGYVRKWSNGTYYDYMCVVTAHELK